MTQQMIKKKYKSRFHHSGAMIDEMLLLVKHYDQTIPQNEWVESIIKDNILGKPSRSWTKEVISGSFLPRFVNGPILNAWNDIKLMLDDGFDSNELNSVLYYITAKYDEFLYDYITYEIYNKYYSGQIAISANNVYDYIQTLPENAFNKPWSDYVKRRLSRGVMSTLRDFKLLEGKGQKKISNYYLSTRIFVYIAFLINQIVKSGDKIIHHLDWKLFLLNPRLVERLFLDAHQQNFVSYHAAGGIVRIEFTFESSEELIHAICR